MKTFREKRCRVCARLFRPLSSLAKACSIECAIRLVEREKKQAERRADQARREKLKTRSDYIREAQAAFNTYVRVRDQGMDCICCGLPLSMGSIGGSFDCGHYRSVGSAPHLRFDERNAHGQRKQCNRWGAGRAVDYRLGLIERIGLAAVERLEADQEPRHWSISDLIAIRDLYRTKKRELVAARKLREAA